MAQHHYVPQFLLSRWADPESGLIEVFDRRKSAPTRVDPRRFAALPDFNVVVGRDGRPDDWIEAKLLASLDSSAAMALRRLEALPRPPSLAKMAASQGWHSNHVMSPKISAAMAMWVAAQAVRSPTFREAVTRSTSRDVQTMLTEHYESQAAEATDVEQKAHFRYMASLRVLVAGFDPNTLPELSAHLITRLGEVLYTEYIWSVQKFQQPALILGDDPVVLSNLRHPERCGSYSQVATRGPDPISMWHRPTVVVERALQAIRDNHFVFMPLGPKHLLTLTSLRMRAGGYDVPAHMATPYNVLSVAASDRWTCQRPADAASEPSPQKG